ncbi:tellurite resistance TerB family protein [Desulfosarcina ovata]|uniref:Protein YebE n=1 Tax=Desulfosarcina ovata subsp. ovata TaxID=2752305 RepID=A0A5K8AEB4_9BACT|nr:tellurite resistance TerB family protein [Desulfosarcina ovata]BBO90917.1 hypothetical protein DSCOOX_40970 [Desulfosarcina ovata subsp. ovata]
MFNPEKLLGGLIRNTTRGSRGGLGSLISGGMAMGALGVAMEAFDHYMNKPQGTAAPPTAPGGSPPPPPPPASASGRPASPPPPPPMPATPASATPPATPQMSSGSTDAVLLIRAMIAAANADGVIDQTERNQILERLEAVELSAEEHAFIVRELLSPADLEAIVAGVTSPELAQQVYSVSLMAIEVDTPQEAHYMTTLAGRLGLDAATVKSVHRSLELE